MIIGEDAFSMVLGLTQIDIPDCVTTIQDGAFSGTDLECIKLPASLQDLGTMVFDFCDQLVSIDLNGYTVIPERTFWSCDALKEVKGSENIIEIREAAFYHCTGLENITFGKALKKIGYSAFYACKAEITYQGTVEEWNTIEKDDKWQIYTDADWVLKRIICTDGEFVPIAQLPGRN